MDRRIFLGTLAGSILAAPLVTEAQQAGPVYRIGVLSPGSAAAGPLEDALRQGLHGLGYMRGVRTGLVASFARPGGNLTGLSNFSDELSGKRLGLVKELIPAVSRLAVLWNADNPGIGLSVKEMERGISQFGVHLEVHGVKSAGDFPNAFQAITRERANALFVFDDVLLTTHKRQILDWAATVRLPVISQYAEIAEAGGLMAYGPNVPDLYRRAAIYVDKILRGIKPADLPVEQPEKLELVINRKTARALGLTIPPSLLARADQVIE